MHIASFHSQLLLCSTVSIAIIMLYSDKPACMRRVSDKRVFVENYELFLSIQFLFKKNICCAAPSVELLQ